MALTANYPPMAVPLKLDITSGDKITPREIEYKFKLLLEDRSISVLAYSLETVMAEKLETSIQMQAKLTAIAVNLKKIARLVSPYFNISWYNLVNNS